MSIQVRSRREGACAAVSDQNGRAPASRANIGGSERQKWQACASVKRPRESEQVENNITDDNEGQSFNKQACLSSIQMPSDNINKTELIRIVKDKLGKINNANDLNN